MKKKLKQATQMLTKALADPKYDFDQHIQIAKRKHQLKNFRINFTNYERSIRGFGIQFDPAIIEESLRQINNSVTESRGDDGLRSEGEQSEQPGESEDLGATEVLY